MNLDKIVEEMIKKAQERGEFDNLPSKGKPIDLTEYCRDAGGCPCGASDVEERWYGSARGGSVEGDRSVKTNYQQDHAREECAALPMAICYVSLNTTGTLEVVSAQSVFITHDFTDTLTIDGKVYSATFTVPKVEYNVQP